MKTPTFPYGKRPPDLALIEDLAADILGYLAADPMRLSRFFDLTGLTPQSLRKTAAQPGFSASMLAYLTSDDRLLLAFAADRGHEPAWIEAVRQRLAHAEGQDG